MIQSGNLQLDWLTFTFFANPYDLAPGFGEFDCFKKEFPEFESLWEDFEYANTARHSFYDSVIIYGDYCRISFNDPVCVITDCHYTEDDNPFRFITEHAEEIKQSARKYNMGVSVCVPSHGLEWLFNLLHVSTVPELFRLLDSRHCRPSRIDFCFDDYTKRFRPSYYEKKYLNREISSRKNCANLIGNDTKGATFYIGSREIEILRVYDKFIQSKGEIDSVRYEAEYHGEKAVNVFHYVIDHDSICFKNFLLGWFKVIDRIDSNTTRCPINTEWLFWLENSVFGEELPTEKLIIPKYTLEQRHMAATEWLVKVCMGHLKGYCELFGFENLRDLVLHYSGDVAKAYVPLLYHRNHEKGT